MNRRQVLTVFAGTGCGMVAGWVGKVLGEAGARQTTAGVVIYSFGLRREAERRGEGGGDLFEPIRFLEHCRGLGAGGVQLPLGIREADYAAQFRRRAEAEGMFVEGIVDLPRDQAELDRFEAQMRTAKLVGAKVVRTVLLPGRRYEFFESAEQFREADRRARQSVELAAKVAERHRVRLAIENHKDHRVAERLALLKHISSPWVGACVDLGNDVALLEDPMESVRAYAPWAMSVHLKDVAVAEYAEGFLLADVPLGRGILDLQQMVNVLRQAKPELRFVLEMITRDPLRVPCLTEKYWATLSEVPGERLARTLRLVRQHARQDLPKVTALSADEQLALEHRNVVESLAFARENLGLR